VLATVKANQNHNRRKKYELTGLNLTLTEEFILQLNNAYLLAPKTQGKPFTMYIPQVQEVLDRIH
jgi:hypothetical protein